MILHGNVICHIITFCERFMICSSKRHICKKTKRKTKEQLLQLTSAAFEKKQSQSKVGLQKYAEDLDTLSRDTRFKCKFFVITATRGRTHHDRMFNVKTWGDVNMVKTFMENADAEHHDSVQLNSSVTSQGGKSGPTIQEWDEDEVLTGT